MTRTTTSKSLLTFVEYPTSGLTKLLMAYSATNPHTPRLGVIKWYPPWRRYVFYPEADMLFDAECLQTVLDRITLLMQEQRASQAERRGSK